MSGYGAVLKDDTCDVLTGFRIHFCNVYMKTGMKYGTTYFFQIFLLRLMLVS